MLISLRFVNTAFPESYIQYLPYNLMCVFVLFNTQCMPFSPGIPTLHTILVFIAFIVRNLHIWTHHEKTITCTSHRHHCGQNGDLRVPLNLQTIDEMLAILHTWILHVCTRHSVTQWHVCDQRVNASEPCSLHAPASPDDEPQVLEVHDDVRATVESSDSDASANKCAHIPIRAEQIQR